MYNILSRIFTVVLCSLISANAITQSDSTHDIRNNHLEYLLKPNAFSLMDQFQHVAVSLFLNGTKPSIEIMKNRSQALVGVCLISDRALFPENRDIEFNLYSIRHKDLRDYTGKGHDGFANFYVKPNNDEEKKLVKKAVSKYLFKNTIPTKNKAYKFAKTHVLKEDKDYLKYFESDSLSLILMDNEVYSYIRQNGNYLIQLEGFRYRKNDEENEVFGEDHFVIFWSVIAIYLIDETIHKPYDFDFKRNSEVEKKEEMHIRH